MVVKRGMSVSFIAALPKDVQREVEAKLRSHIAGTPDLADRDEVTFPYVTNMYWCRKRA